MKKRYLAAVAALAILGGMLAGPSATCAQGEPAPGLVIETVTPDDTKAIRKLIKEYCEALRAGERDKAVKLYETRNADELKLARVVVDTDLVIVAFEKTVEKRFGKEAKAKVVEAIGWLPDDNGAGTKVEGTVETEEGGQNQVNRRTMVTVDMWPDCPKSADERLFGPTSIEKTQAGWKLSVGTDPAGIVGQRHWQRDVQAEIKELTEAIVSGKIADQKALMEAIEKLIKEERGEVGFMEGAPGAAPDAAPPMAPVEP